MSKEYNTIQTKGRPSVGGPFDLVDHNGEPKTDEDFKGYFKLIYFGFTHCPDICPEELDKMAEIVDTINKDTNAHHTVYPLFITIDPKRDGVQQVKEYVQEFHPMLLGLTGTPAQIKKAAKNYRVYFSETATGPDAENDYLMDHSVFYFFMDPNNEFVDVFGKDQAVGDTAARITGLVGEFMKANPNYELKRVPENVTKAQ